MSQEPQPAPSSPAVPPVVPEVPDEVLQSLVRSLLTLSKPILGIDFGSQKVVVAGARRRDCIYNSPHAAYNKARGKLPTIIPNNLSNQATPYAAQALPVV